MEIELSEQCVTRLFASSATSALRCTMDEGHLGGILCSEAKSDSDLPQTIILKSESYNLMCWWPVSKSWWLVPSITRVLTPRLYGFSRPCDFSFLKESPGHPKKVGLGTGPKLNNF